MSEEKQKDPKKTTQVKKSMTLKEAMRLSKDRYGEVYKRLSRS